MKQKVQLFINNEEVDVFQDGSINIQSSIKDVKDPGKIFTDFSKNFKLPASDINNKIFKHYYNAHVIDGFSARVAQEARIEINHRVFREGYIMLEGVDLKYNKPYSYRVTFYGNLRFLREKLDNTKLSELTFLKNFSLNYQSTGTDSIKEFLTTSKNITDQFGTSHTQPLVVPLITHTDRLYYNSSKTSFYGFVEDGNLYYDSADYPLNGKKNGLVWDQLKPAIRIDLIIKAIEKELSAEGETVSFSTDFFNSTNLDYYNLYMWLHQKEGKLESAEDVQERKISTPVSTFGIGTAQSLISGTNVVGMTAQFTNSSGIQSGGFGDRVKVTINNDRVESVIARFTGVSTTDTTNPYTLVVKREGIEYERVEVPGDEKTSSDYVEFELDPGTYTFIVETAVGVSIDFDGGFLLRLIARIDREFGVNVPDITRTATGLTSNAIGVFYADQNMPDMTVLEFLTGLFKMFNLVAEVRNDSLTEKTIVVKTLDNYYLSSGKETDLTEKIDISTGSVNKALPYTKITFEYDDVGSLLAKQHGETSGQVWGGESLLVDEVVSKYKKEYTIKPKFGHMKYERLIDANNNNSNTELQVGFSVTKSSEDADTGTQEKYNPYIGKPVLFYPILISSGEDIPYLYNNRIGVDIISSYFIPSNAVSLEISKTNHFGAENSEWDYNSATYKENLYSLYYDNYISSVFSPRARLTKLNAILTNAFITNYSLADTIIVRGEKYRINTIDLDIVTGKSKLELLPYYEVINYLCLNILFQVRVEAVTGGFLYVFDDKYGVYQAAEGTYTLSDIPSTHPIAFQNNGKTSVFTYTGTNSVGTKTGLDGNTYEYFWGDITLNILGDFETISYECYNHGYMGGENNLQYNSTCVQAPAPAPETGDLTVDRTDITSDSSFTRADQTEE